MRKAWAWTCQVDEDTVRSPSHEVICRLDDCEFSSPESRRTIATQSSSPDTQFTFEEHSPETHEGTLSVSESHVELLVINFKPRCAYFWQVPGQNDGVYHFPNISAEMIYKGRSAHAFGYCKRYWGDYDGPWGYQFIHGISSDEKSCVWTADATFGDDEYNYFKMVGADGSLSQAEKTDTYHNNQRAFWRPSPSGANMEAELTECAKMEFFLKSDSQFSKLVERFGKVDLKKDGNVVWSGYGFNEICFGTVG